jgi:uncharacterized membrane protein YebE (DUF533 family)
VQVNSLDVERLLGSVISGALGGKKKKHRGVARSLTGGKSSFLNASTLLALGGLAWGVYETMTQQGSSGPGAGPAPGPTPGAPPRPVASGPVVPPPLPQAGAVVVPPPLPVTGASPPVARVEVSPDVLRVIRLTLSAARADGTLTAHEREAILSQARGVGAEALIAAELDAPKPLEEILGNAPGGRVADDLYTLAFSIVRADEAVLPAEREYLSRLAAALGIAADTATRLEQQAADRIAAASRAE